MADKDNTDQIDQEIQNRVNKLEVCIANFDGKKQVLEIAMREEIQALKKARDEAGELRLIVLHESGDTGNNPEGSHRISAETTERPRSGAAN